MIHRRVLRTSALLLAVLAAASAGAQGGRLPRRIPPGPRGFFPPRVVDNSPIHPRAVRTQGPIPFPPERPWIRLDTAHFILFTSGSERAARAIADDFEKLTALLLRTSPWFRLPPNRTRVFIFNERRELQPYLNATRGGDPVDAIGVTVRHPGGSTMLLDAGARGGDVFTPRHELVHDLLRHNERPLPLWVEEGVAEYYSNAGMPIPEHVSRVRGRPRIPLATLFAMQPSDPRASSADFYAQSWAAVATLKRLDDRAFFELLRDLERGLDPSSAVFKHYGRSLAELSIAMRKVGAPAAPLPMHQDATAAEIRGIERAELLYQLATLLAYVTGGEDEADRHFRAAMAAGPRNGEAHVRYAEFLAARERLAEAREVAEQALGLLPDEPRLYAVIGTASSELPALECAHERLPGRSDVTLALFEAYIRRGDRENADALFPRLADSPRANDARRILLRAGTARADALAREGQLAEAARVLRELAVKMPARTRAQLEEQAVRLEKLP